jgi:hypothetical protein
VKSDDLAAQQEPGRGSPVSKGFMMSRSILFLAALCAVALSLIMSPDRLASVGIMDDSLASDNLLTRNTALDTIAATRLALGVLAVVLAILAVWAPRIEALPWFQRRLREGSSFPARYEDHQRKVFTPTARLALSGCLLAIVYLMVGNRIFDQQTLDWLNVEDGVLEWLSALLLLAASGLAVKLSRAMPIKAHRWMHVFMAVVFFVMFGEEISWGQRLLGFSTPEAMAQINVQNEVNLHNSFGYLFDHLFILCFFLWGCVVPLLYWKIPIWRWFQSRLGLPFASAGLSLAMLAATLFQPQLTDTLFGTVSGLRVAELRETLSALCLLLLVVESKRLTSSDHRG